MFLPPRTHRTSTAYVALDRRRCEACWECVDARPKDVLRRLSLGPHRHAIVERADECTGCLARVKTCEAGALTVREA